MDIYFLGVTAIRIKGKKTTVVVDPFTKEKAGIKFEKTEADAVLLTEKNAPKISLDQIGSYRVVIDGPGEYEVGGVAVVGYKTLDLTTYYLKIDGISLLDLGWLDKSISESDLDRYPNIDILFVAAGKESAPLIAKLEPKIVIPMYVDEPTLTTFLKEVGKEEIKPQPKLSITRDKLPAEMEVVVLE